VKRYLRFFYLICLISLPLTSGWAANQSNSDKGLQAAFQQALYGVEATPGGFAASNPSQQISARFISGEVLFQSQESSAGLRLQGYGYGERLIQAQVPRLTGSGNRIDYRRGSLTEWYVNRPEGVEQGFTLAARPGLAGPGERLTIVLEVTGGLEPVLAPAGDAVLLESAGQAQLRYTGLRAWDATGRELPARLDVRGRDVRLAIADMGAVYPVTVDPFVQAAKLTAGTDGASGDSFGISVAVDGTTAVIGAYKNASSRGAAYVFVCSSGVWTQQAKLVAADSATTDDFGFAVAVMGDTAVIGAYNKYVNPYSSAGAAYVFTRTGTTWSQQAKLLAGDPANSDFFGYSVALSSDTAVIGAYAKRVGSNAAQGAAYVFIRTGSTWSQQQKLVASDGAYHDYFGTSVAVGADTAVIGAYFRTNGANTQQGAAYLFTRSGTTWTQQTILLSSDGTGGDNFGMSAALNGNTAVIGAPQKGGSGVAYVFVGSGATWSQTKLTASDPASGDLFGWSVAINGDTAVVGAYGKDNKEGAAYGFGRNGSTWSQLSKATADTRTANDDFGISVAVSGSTIVIGANGNLGLGAAYVFAPSAATLTVASTPPGLSFTATGTSCPSGTLTTPYALPVGIGCTISFPSPATDTTGDTTYTFQQWNDSYTTNPRSFAALWLNTTFTAQFGTQYLLTTSASPASAGQVTGAGWYNAQANPIVAALPNPGYVFNGFTGSLSGMTTPQGVAMNGPRTVTGAFLQLPGSALTAMVLSKSGTQNARSWTVSLANGGPGSAYSPFIAGLMLTQTYGTACTPVRISPVAFPVSFSTLAVNGAAALSVLFDFTGCPANARFTVLVASVANSGSSVGATTLANQTW